MAGFIFSRMAFTKSNPGKKRKDKKIIKLFLKYLAVKK